MYLAWENGDPFRLFFGTDSWGNTCGRKNTKLELDGIETPENSGEDLTDYKYVGDRGKNLCNLSSDEYQFNFLYNIRKIVWKIKKVFSGTPTDRSLRLFFRNVFYYQQLLMKGDVRVCVKKCMTQENALETDEDLKVNQHDVHPH